MVGLCHCGIRGNRWSSSRADSRSLPDGDGGETATEEGEVEGEVRKGDSRPSSRGTSSLA
jgi:hypothetical protein